MKLQAATDALKTAKQTRDDAQTSYKDQYSALPDLSMTDANGDPIDPAQQLQNYLAALRNQSAAVATYKTTLDQLRKLGLDDETYKKLLSEGTADQSFANQLLAGGKTAVQGLNKLDAQLMKVSATLATNAAKNLYQAGVDAAQGLVNGLTKKEHDIHNKMEEIANDMLRTLRQKLGIKSPSKMFEEVGVYSMQGLANGFSKSSHIMTEAIDGAVDSALSSIKNSVRKINDLVSNELSPSPVITPILDLSYIRSQSAELAGLTNVSPITAAASYGQASMISQSGFAAQSEDETTAVVGPTVKFEQNNYSPNALTEIEIYRQTRNQLSQLKSALAVT